MLVRRRVVNHFRCKLDEFEKELSVKKNRQRVAWKYPTDTVEQLRAVTDSYFGHFGWANSSRLTTRLFETHPVLRACFMTGISLPRRITPRYQLPRSVKIRLHHEYRWWVVPVLRSVELHQGTCKPEFPLWAGEQNTVKILIFFPVGTFYEFYDSQAAIAHKVLGLKLITGMRGFRNGCGFHRRMFGHYLGKAVGQGYHVALLGIGIRNRNCCCGKRLVRLFQGQPASGV